jgi:signal transduction histidine kinase
MRLHPWVEARPHLIHPHADDAPRGRPYLPYMALVPRWLRRSMYDDDAECVPTEVVGLRVLGILTLAAFVLVALANMPDEGLSARGLAILLGTVLFIVAAIRALPMQRTTPGRRILWLIVVAAVSVGLLALQPHGLWVVAPYLIAAGGAMRLDAKVATALFLADLSATSAVAVAVGQSAAAISIITGVIPFFLFMRLMRRTREAHEVTKCLVRELEASRAAEAETAAVAERARLAREMHDVLAHSLSALALQLESTRLLADDRGVDPEVVRAVERAHTLAASGLDEARRAINALRGDELPALETLVEAFRDTSGIPCAYVEEGTPRALATDARLTVYRTAQEALTNVHRHADATRVEVSLAYRDDATVLTVADHGSRARVPAGRSSGGGYGLTGMRERAELLGGRLVAGPTDDGFRVELCVPA